MTGAGEATVLATPCQNCGDDIGATDCRICGQPGMASVLCLGRTPLANDFRLVGSPPADTYPLHVAHCQTCSLTQLATLVPPERLFSQYAYFSSSSVPVIEHGVDQRRFARHRLGIAPGSTVVDVGSNDGYLLKGYLADGYRVLGVDPARNVTAVARAEGVPTVDAYFSDSVAQEIRAEYGPADLIHANNVLAHTPDPGDLLSGCRTLLSASNGRLVIEVPYIKDLVTGGHFDTIYHEHVYYFSVTALDRLLSAAGLTMVGVEHIPVHGGSLRVVASPVRQSLPSSVQQWLRAEEAEGLAEASYYQGFARDVNTFIARVRNELGSLASAGYELCGYGAPAKAAIMMSGASLPLRFVCDSTPYKQGRLLPGSSIPVVSPDRLSAERPDFCFIFAWNYADAIIAANRDYLLSGGTFIKAEAGSLRYISADSSQTS